MSKYARVYAVIKQINQQGASISKEELVEQFTSGRTQSLSALSHTEFQEFERQLINNSQTKYTSKTFVNQKNDKLRKAIIAIFKSIGRTTDDAKQWAENYGVNGVKKKFNYYNGSELFLLRRNAEKVKADFLKSLRKKI